MAETVKKSRIVSETDEDLEEALMEEFNMRLKCMSQDNLNQTDVNEDFIKAEQDSYDEMIINGYYNNTPHHTNGYHSNCSKNEKTDDIVETVDQSYIDMAVTCEEDESSSPHYEDIDDENEMKKPDVTLTECIEDNVEVIEPIKSVKDRMLLSTDGESCLLFTQTVTSPMLTPSEENVDFLKGFQREYEENVYENTEFLKNQQNEVIYENLKDVSPQDNIYENLKDLSDPEAIYQNVSELREEVQEEENDDNVNMFENESTQVTESYVETTTIDSSNSSPEKALKKKKSKKSRKEEKENISVKSSFSKFDALQKKNVLHIRSSDSSKAQEKFNGAQVDNSNCRSCGKIVFQMEQIKAEKAVWHRNCFRCIECNKQLNVDTYQSNEGTLYCKPHFKALFTPKAVEDDTSSSDKPDLGLEELQSLNVKERFQVFENQQNTEMNNEENSSVIVVKRSPSILSKLAKFQAKGMDIGVTDDSLNGIPIEESSSDEEQSVDYVEDGIIGEDADLIRAKRVQKEKPFHFTGMSDVKSKWESGGEKNVKDERREERKQEIQSIRNRIFMGKQGKMKEAYEQAVMESESCINLKKEQPIEVCDTKSLKEKFEKGDIIQERNDKERDSEENEVYESEISKKSRSLFLELDANASKPPSISPVVTTKIDVKKAREASTPDRDISKDTEIIRSDEIIEDSVIAKESHTATKMLNKFRQMEENLTREHQQQPQGLKPLKRFTPPPEPARHGDREDDDDEEEDDEDSEEEETDQTDNVQNLDLLEAQKAARAKQLRAKFEKWEANEIKREQNNSVVNIIEEFGEEQSQVESTKTLRARFESMKEIKGDNTQRQPRVKVNRFV